MLANAHTQNSLVHSCEGTVVLHIDALPVQSAHIKCAAHSLQLQLCEPSTLP